MTRCLRCFCIDGHNRFPAPVKVGHNEDSSAFVWRSEIRRRKWDRKRRVSKSSQPLPDVGHPVARTTRDVFHHDPIGSELTDAPEPLVPKAASSTVKASLLACAAEVLARSGADDDAWSGKGSAPCVSHVVDGSVGIGPVAGKVGAAVGFVLNLPNRRTKARPLKAKG